MARNHRLSRPHFTFRPGIEQLEDRAVPSTVDVSVTKTTPTADASGNVNAGQAIQYQIVVSNAASATGDATGVTLSDMLPADVTGATWTSTVRSIPASAMSGRRSSGP